MKLNNDQINILIELMKSSKKKGNLATAALVLEKGKVIASADSLVASNNDMTAHSERMLVSKVGNIKNSPYAPGLTMITVVESCVMCMSACSQAGYEELAYIIPADKYVGRVDYVTDIKEGSKEDIAKLFNGSMKLTHLKEYEDEFSKIFEELMLN